MLHRKTSDKGCDEQDASSENRAGVTAGKDQCRYYYYREDYVEQIFSVLGLQEFQMLQFAKFVRHGRLAGPDGFHGPGNVHDHKYFGELEDVKLDSEDADASPCMVYRTGLYAWDESYMTGHKRRHEE